MDDGRENYSYMIDYSMSNTIRRGRIVLSSKSILRGVDEVFIDWSLENCKMAFKTPGYFYDLNSEVFNHRNRRECVLVS